MSRGERRPKASRDQILEAARALGVRDGWRAVTIRSIAAELGYAHPLLYEHFRDKEDVLTQLAIEGLRTLEATLTTSLPDDPRAAVLDMTGRYWTFMLENTQLYRLMNGMDGTPIDAEQTNQEAQKLCTLVGAVLKRFVGQIGDVELAHLTDETWALLHGMATLYLDRSAPFDLDRVRNATLRLLGGDR